MVNIHVGRYGINDGTVVYEGEATSCHSFKDGVLFDAEDQRVGHIERHWQGWIEDEGKTWIAFIDAEGRPIFFLDRCHCGGILTEKHPEDLGFFCVHRENPANAAFYAEQDLASEPEVS